MQVCTKLKKFGSKAKELHLVGEEDMVSWL
jgi:hypothetical protein